METINNVELRDPDRFPDDAVLKDVLGPSFGSYKDLLEIFAASDMHHEWRYYRDGKAWLCKVQYKRRTIVWMSAWRGYMQATIYFPLSKLDLVMALNLDNATRERIRSTKNVGKSKPCIFEVRHSGILEDFAKVMELKIRTK